MSDRLIGSSGIEVAQCVSKYILGMTVVRRLRAAKLGTGRQ